MHADHDHDITALAIGPEIDPGVPWTATLGQDGRPPLALALKCMVVQCVRLPSGVCWSIGPVANLVVPGCGDNFPRLNSSLLLPFSPS